MEYFRQNIKFALTFTALFGAAVLVFLKNVFPKHPTQGLLSSLAILNERSRTTFSSEQHYSRLDSFARYHSVSDYTKLGFYRRNSPVTDFRGFGILTLDVMENSQIIDTFDKALGYGLTMINIGFYMLQRMNKNPKFLCKFRLDPDDCIKYFSRYLDTEMEDFAVFWRKYGAEIMYFNQLLERWIRDKW